MPVGAFCPLPCGGHFPKTFPSSEHIPFTVPEEVKKTCGHMLSATDLTPLRLAAAGREPRTVLYGSLAVELLWGGRGVGAAAEPLGRKTEDSSKSPWIPFCNQFISDTR